MTERQPLPIAISDFPQVAGKRVGIIGAGGVASFAHIPAYRQLGIDVAALVDQSELGLGKAQVALGPTANAQTWRSIESFAADPGTPDLDMLDLALPSPLHEAALDLLIDILGAECPPILVQKPLAQTHAAAVRLAKRAKALHCRLFVNLNGRYVPTFRKAAHLIDRGEIGRPLVATILNRGLNKKSPGEWRSDLPRLILYEMAIHHLDFLLWTFGPVSSVHAIKAHVPNLGVAGEAFASVSLTFESGAIATVTEDWSCRIKDAWQYHPSAEHISISGSLGSLVATPKRLDLSTDTSEAAWETEADWFPDAFAGPMAEALAAHAENRTSMLNAEDHLAVLQLLEAAYESAETGRVVAMDAGNPKPTLAAYAR